MFEKPVQPRLIDDQEMLNIVKLVENSTLRLGTSELMTKLRAQIAITNR